MTGAQPIFRFIPQDKHQYLTNMDLYDKIIALPITHTPIMIFMGYQCKTLPPALCLIWQHTNPE